MEQEEHLAELCDPLHVFPGNIFIAGHHCSACTGAAFQVHVCVFRYGTTMIRVTGALEVAPLITLVRGWERMKRCNQQFA